MEIQKDIKVTMNQCGKCGYEWIKRVKDPKQCPKCKQYEWKNTTHKKH